METWWYGMRSAFVSSDIPKAAYTWLRMPLPFVSFDKYHSTGTEIDVTSAKDLWLYTSFYICAPLQISWLGYVIWNECVFSCSVGLFTGEHLIARPEFICIVVFGVDRVFAWVFCVLCDVLRVKRWSHLIYEFDDVCVYAWVGFAIYECRFDAQFWSSINHLRNRMKYVWNRCV